MTLYLPVGIPGSGKSFLGNQHFMPDEVVEPDYYRYVLTGNRAAQDANAVVFGIVLKIVYYRLRRGLDVYLDATNLERDLWPEHDDTVLIFMDTPIDVCYYRNSIRSQAVPEKAMRRMERKMNYLWSVVDQLDYEVVSSGEFTRK